MSGAARRLERRKEARQGLATLFRQPSQLQVIHYSCESFTDTPGGRSPRITSIAIRHVGSRQTRSFSIHQVAERRGLSHTEMEDSYDLLEKKMLDEFYEFVRAHISSYWIHWNMRDINYGFLALAHRYRVLGGEPTEIPESHLFDLASKLIDIYGGSYAPHPRLERIMEINRISGLYFLAGRDEARAFREREYVKLHQSTLRKVDVIHTIAEREWDGSLHTNAKLRDQLGTSVTAWVDWATGTWVFKLAGGIGIALSLGRGLAGLF
jgi:hypothetical protein